MSVESVMPSNHLILCSPLLLLPSVFPSIMVFSSESALCINGQSIGASASALVHSSEYPRLISSSDWFDLLNVQGTLKSLLQYHSLKASVLQHSASPWSSSHIHTWLLENHSFDYMDVMSLLFNMLSSWSQLFKSKWLLLSWLQSLSRVILEPKKIKSVTVSPSICHGVMGLDAKILVF